MATRDLMSAMQSLSELSTESLDDEHDDIELAYAKLGRIIKVNRLRGLRQRTRRNAQANSGSLGLREISET